MNKLPNLMKDMKARGMTEAQIHEAVRHLKELGALDHKDGVLKINDVGIKLLKAHRRKLN